MAVRSRRARVAVLTLVTTMAVAGVLGGCGVQRISGTPKLLGAVDPGTVAGLPATDGPSGLRDGVSPAPLPVENTDSGDVDRIALDTVADVQDYWKKHFPTDFNGRQFEPVKRLVSYDSTGKPLEVCRQNTAGFANAFYCPLDDSISWDRELLPNLRSAFGPIAIVTVLAHEMGHAVQRKLGAASNVNQATPTIVLEQQADCYAAAFLRSVAEGKAAHLRLSTGDGVSKALATLFAVRDAPGGSAAAKSAHGNAFDRVTAFQFGFASGPQRCARMDVNEIKQRITEMPFASEGDQSSGGNVPINNEYLQLLEDSLKEAFKDTGATLPTLTGRNASCKDAHKTTPVSYCPSTNTVAFDINKLVAIGTPPKRGQGNGIGDFAAFAEVASRYVLSVQKAVGFSLDDPAAGLRTACLVGAWTGLTMTHPINRTPRLLLTAGDLDKAVAELLSNDSLIASDVNGKTVRSGFARVEAFRIGFLSGSGPCSEKFS
jgi:predicted metalloprotease